MKKINLFDFAIEILIIIVIFIMPTIFDRRLGIVFSGTKTAWMRAFGAIILGVWALKLLITRKHRFIRTPLDWPVVSFLLCTTIASLTSVHVYTSLAGFYGRYEGLTSWYLFGLFFFVITNYIKSFDQLKRIIVTIVSAATLMAFYSIIQRHEWDPYMWGGVVTWQRVIGMIGQPNFLAAYMLMAFFLILALFLMKKPSTFIKSTGWLEQLVPLSYFVAGPVTFLLMIYNLEAHNILLWYFGFAIITASALLFAYSYERLHPFLFNVVLGITLILIYITILYTQSRGGYMGLFTGIVLFAIVAGRNWNFLNWRKTLILGFLIILISSVTMMRPEYSPFARFASEITTEADGNQKDERMMELKGAAGSRGETWKSAFRIISDYPVFGIGPEVLKMVFPRYETELFRFKEAFHVKQDRCHNETFDVGVTKGMLTFFVYLWLLSAVFRMGWLKAKDSKDQEKLLLAGMLAAVLSYLVQNQFSFGVVAITSLFWMIWGMVVTIGAGIGEGEGEERKLSWEDIPWLPVAAVIIVVIFLIYISFFSFRGDIWFKSGKTRLQLRQIPQAVEDFEKSLRIFPFEGGTVSHLGIAYLNLSQTTSEKMEYLNKAIAVLKYGTQIDPYNADNFYMLSRIYLTMADMGDAEALGLAQKYAETAIKIDPYYAEVYYTLGLILEKQEQYEKAAWNFERAFLVNPSLVEPMKSLEAVYKKTGKPAESLKSFEKAFKRYPDNFIIMDRIAKLYFERGKIDEAFKISEKMIRISPKSASGYVLRAEIYAKRGDVELAFSDLQQAILNDPKSVDAHNELGRIYLLKGNKERAKEEFNQVLLLEPNNTAAKKMLERLK